MFCPNCGTKNDDSAAKCSQCGFDTKKKGPAAKHKGTVMMQGSPAIPAGGASTPKKPAPNLKGTMVGVAPPDLSGSRPKEKPAAQPQARPAAKPRQPNSKLKGTMVGVAPPGIEDLRKQAAASQAAAKTGAPKAEPAKEQHAVRQPAAKPPQAGPSAAAKSPPSKLKGTMIGVAPPNMSAEVEAAKAKLAAQKAQNAKERAASEPKKEAAAATQQEPPKATPGAAASPKSKEPPSQLKGTMIGVAPPNVQQQIDDAKQAAAAKQAATPQPAAEQQPSAAHPPQDDDPPSEPDPLGGTVVGTSPFAPGGPAGGTHGDADTSGSTQAPAAGSGFEDQTPAGPARADETASEESPSADEQLAQPAVAPAPPAAPHAPIAADHIPITKSSLGPIVLIITLVLAAAVGAAYFFIGQSGSEEDAETEDAASERAAPEGDSAAP